MDKKLQQVVHWRDNKGLSWAKVAAKLGVSPRTARRWYEKAQGLKAAPASPSPTPAPPEHGDPVAPLAAKGDKVVTGDFDMGLPVPEVSAEAYSDPFGGPGGMPGDEAVGALPSHELEYPEHGSFFERYSAPLPPHEEWRSGEVCILGPDHRPVADCPDFDEFRDDLAQLVESTVLADLPFQINGKAVLVDVKLLPEHRNRLAKAWAIPVYRVLRAIGPSGPVAELGEAVLKTVSLRGAIMKALETHPDMLENIRVNEAPAEAQDDG